MEGVDDVVEVNGKKDELWPKTNTDYFVTLMEEEVKKGNRVTTTFTPQSWSLMLKKLVEKTGYHYTHDQLKNKFNVLRQEYRCCKTLCEQSGMTRDPVTGVFFASEDLWERLIKVNKLAKKFKKKGCPYYDKLCIIFGDTTATGVNARMSTSLPSDSEDEVVRVEETQLEDAPRIERKRARRGRRGDNLNRALSKFFEGFGAEAKKRTDVIREFAHTCSNNFNVGGLGGGESSRGADELDDVKPALECLGKLGIEGVAYGKAFNKIQENKLWRDMFMSIDDERKKDVVMSLIH